MLGLDECKETDRILESALQLYTGDYLAEDEQECIGLSPNVRDYVTDISRMPWH